VKARADFSEMLTRQNQRRQTDHLR